MRNLVLSIALLAAGSTPAVAQRVDLFAYRDSLATIADAALLVRMQAALPLPGVATDADAVLRRGLIALRIHEVTGDGADVRRAREALERGLERFPSDARLHTAQALALLASPEVRIPSPGGVLDGVTLAQSVAELFGRDARTRARGALERALRAEPSYGPAAALLAGLAVADGRDRAALEDARTALLAARAAGGGSAEVARALSDVEAALGNYADAAAAADRSLAGKSNASALHARAVALFLQPGHEAAGGAAYADGIRGLDAEAAERYYADVEPIVTAAEAAEWRIADLSAKRFWLDRFWGRRAAASGVLPAERIAAHYRRLAAARQGFLRNSRRGVDGAGVLLAEASTAGSRFDDRGIVLLRHGAPARVVQSGGRGLLPNETWVYGRESDNLLLHFVALRGANDFSLVGDLFSALDPAAALSLAQREQAVMTLIEDRAAYEPGYAAAAGRLRNQLQRGEPLDGTEIRAITERVEADYRRDARDALDEDRYEPRYDRPLAFDYDLFTFRSAAGRTELTAAFAVPRAALTERDGAFPARLSVILLDTLTGAVTRRDTLQRLSARTEREGDGILRGHVTLRVDPSEHVVHRVVVRDEAGQAGGFRAGTSPLRSYAGGGLLLSDIVLAEPDSAGEWRRGDTRFTLTLPRTFQPERPFTLYYEVYGLADGASYRTRIRVEPLDGGGILDRVRSLFGGGAGALDLRFEDVAATGPDGAIAEIRRLGSDLPPGSYRLVVTVVAGATGGTATTEIRFEVVA